jgi:hypothetical protein
LLIGSTGVSYSLATGVWPWTEPRAIRTGPKPPPVNPFAKAHGRHLVAYTFFSSDCGWSGLPRSRETIRALRTGMRSAHGTEYAEISVVGVDLDTDLTKGLAFLADIGGGKISGAFDQILVGGSWLNDKVLSVIWTDQLIPPALPQILVVERVVGADECLSTSRLTVSNDRVVANIVGELELFRWARQGYRLEPSGAPDAGGDRPKETTRNVP